jgi:hypothetical protein
MNTFLTLFSHTGRVLIDSDAAWVVKYLAAKREFSQSFQHYLKHVSRFLVL